jgi:hypothetical protein
MWAAPGLAVLEGCKAPGLTMWSGVSGPQLLGLVPPQTCLQLWPLPCLSEPQNMKQEADVTHMLLCGQQPGLETVLPLICRPLAPSGEMPWQGQCLVVLPQASGPPHLSCLGPGVAEPKTHFQEP